MTLTLRLSSEKIFEIYDLDNPKSTPIKTYTERWEAIQFMQRYDFLPI